MPTRAEHLEDIKARLSGKIPQVGDRIYRSRVQTLSVEKFPSICLYAPQEESGESLVTGGSPQFQPTHTLAIEIRVAGKDGFDLEAGAIAEQVKVLLLTDQDWLKRFKPYPRLSIRQFLDRRGEQTFCGEVLTLTAMDRRPTEYKPNAPMLSAITLQTDIDGDGTAEITVTLTPPPAED